MPTRIYSTSSLHLWSWPQTLPLPRLLSEGGSQVTLANCTTAFAVVNGHIQTLWAVVNGNGLGHFHDVPHCSTWFGTLPPATRTSPVSRGATERHTTDAGRTPAGRVTSANLAEVTERLSSLGALEFDLAAPNAKANFIDKITVRAKKRGSRVAERLCMRYLTKDFPAPTQTVSGPTYPTSMLFPNRIERK